VAVERVHSLASPGKGTKGRFNVYANGTVEGLLTAHPPSWAGDPGLGQAPETQEVGQVPCVSLVVLYPPMPQSLPCGLAKWTS
jgi:hypothetical protein